MQPLRRAPVAALEEVRRANLGRLVRRLHLDGPATRSSLAAETGLNRSTIKALTEELAGSGLVSESPGPRGQGEVGRPSLVVVPRPISAQVVALDLAVEHLAVLRVGLGGVVLSRQRLRRAPGELPAEAVIDELAALATAAIAEVRREGTCLGIGVGVCGVVDQNAGTVRFAPNLGWVDVPLAGRLAARLGTELPVQLGNDGDLGALAESLRGAARGSAHVVYLSGEVGVGGGLLVAGQPLGGAAGFAGEVGHMVVDPRGRTCRCGRRGCWETEVGDVAVLQSTRAPAGMLLEDVIEAHVAGARWTRAGMARVARFLGQGVATLVNVLNPEVVVFGGATALLYAALRDDVHAHVDEALAAPRAVVRLEIGQLGEDTTAVGAAELVFAPMLDDPVGRLAAVDLAG